MDEKKKEAERFWKEALDHQAQGDLERAVDLYWKSIEVCPTAEGHTFLGWAYSLMGRVEEAIEHCHIAIRLDRDFGNPYNDIGCYLMMKGKHDEAVPWLEKAMRAKRYDSRCLPYYNMGRIFERKGRWTEALGWYQQAMEISPNFVDAYRALRQLQGRLN
ncbi:MAG: tetratricopeptide repeat protein [Acidobacteria bacterium]|nr:tetratricopeptide repeat protein [Acidobacteriota bacterium]